MFRTCIYSHHSSSSNKNEWKMNQKKWWRREKKNRTQMKVFFVCWENMISECVWCFFQHLRHSIESNWFAQLWSMVYVACNQSNVLTFYRLIFFFFFRNVDFNSTFIGHFGSKCIFEIESNVSDGKFIDVFSSLFRLVIVFLFQFLAFLFNRSINP